MTADIQPKYPHGPSACFYQTFPTQIESESEKRKAKSESEVKSLDGGIKTPRSEHLVVRAPRTGRPPLRKATTKPHLQTLIVESAIAISTDLHGDTKSSDVNPIQTLDRSRRAGIENIPSRPQHHSTPLALAVMTCLFCVAVRETSASKGTTMSIMFRPPWRNLKPNRRFIQLIGLFRNPVTRG